MQLGEIESALKFQWAGRFSSKTVVVRDFLKKAEISVA